MKNLIAALAVFAFACSAHAQQLEGTFPADGGAISVTASGGDVNAAGLDFKSSNDGLIPIPDNAGAPFTFLLSNTPSNVTYGNLGTSVTFAAGTTTALSVGAQAGAEITASWGNGPTPVAFDVSAAGGGAAPGNLLDGLINYYPLNSNFYDLAGSVPGNTSTNDDHGTQPGSSVSFTGGYAVFNGDDEAYAEVPDSADVVAAGESLSISAWFQVTSLDDGWQGLIAHGESSDWRIARRGGDNVISSRVGAGDIPGGAEGPAIDDGAWHHVVAVADMAGDQSLYVDGTLVASNPYASITDNGSGRMMIGGNPDTGGFRTWNGGIDDIGMWDRALSAAEVATIYDSGRGALVPEPATGLLALMSVACLGLLRRRR